MMKNMETSADIPPHLPITVTASGFRDNEWLGRPYLSIDKLASLTASERAKAVIIIHGDQEVETLKPWLDDITAVEIHFDTAHDGRGFSLAHRLKNIGFKGSIRGAGSLHVDQFPHAIRCGISSLNLTQEAALRMPEQYWVDTAASLNLTESYQTRLGLTA